MSRTIRAGVVLAGLGLAVSSCSTASGANPEPAAASGSPAALSTVRVGFFPNLTHAPAFVALQEGYFKEALTPAGVKIAPSLFNAGPDAVNALFGDAVDIAYIGSNPTISAWTQSKGAAIKVISGAASAGASLVVKADLTSAAALKGKTLASPQLGNAQDVALRFWLKSQGLATDAQTGTGDVSITPMANSEAVTAFQSDAIDGAWVPEPFASQLVAAGGKVLVDESSLWPRKQFVTTNIVVRAEFLQQHADVVQAILLANTQAVAFIDSDPAAAQSDFNAGLKSLTGSELDPALLATAWKHVIFTVDPLKSTLVTSAAHAIEVGLLDQAKVDAAGGFDALYDLAPLNSVLVKEKLPAVQS